MTEFSIEISSVSILEKKSDELIYTLLTRISGVFMRGLLKQFIFKCYQTILRLI